MLVFLVCGLTLLFTPNVSGIECPVCTNVPGSGASKCDSGKVPKVTCPHGFDQCISLKGKMTVLNLTQDFEQKNCSNNVSCDSASDDNECKVLNMTNMGFLTSCTLTCTTPDTTPHTSGVKKLGPRAFFGAMFLLPLIPSVF